jgi:hypothetical protein
MNEADLIIDESAGGAATRQDVPTETYGITCPSCGGSLHVHEGERSIRCGYCDSALYVTRPKGVRSFMLAAKISAGKARMTALRYIADQTKGRVKGRHTSIVDTQLIHVPFWRMHGRLMGWLCGERINLREVEVVSEGEARHSIKSLQEEREPYAKLVFKKVDWSTPACVLPYLGIQGISLRSSFINWDIFDYEMRTKHNFALPMKGIQNARKDAFNYLTKLTMPHKSTVQGSKYHMFDSSFSLYYYPVYFIRYRHNKRIYTITIDANDGRVTRGDVPQFARKNYRNLFFVPAAFAFLAVTYAPLALIALLIVYASDMFTSEGFVLPHRWLLRRLNKWFGGE